MKQDRLATLERTIDGIIDEYGKYYWDTNSLGAQGLAYAFCDILRRLERAYDDNESDD